MSNVNCTQVQSTNDASTVSKCSAVNKSYFQDDFIEEFVDRKKTRASLIHLGYYTRATILNSLLLKYIEFLKVSKIISCGCGFDTTYWRLSKTKALNDESVFIEIDFPDVIRRKVSLIQKSKKLSSFTSIESKPSEGIWRMNLNYFLIEADLSDISLIRKFLTEVKISFDVPTLFLSECVITYMNVSDSDQLIKWMAENFKNGGFINYEQIHPDDGFGEVMLKHFDKLNSSLLSVKKYSDCQSHCNRYKQTGFQNSFAVSEWDALIWLTSEEERRRVLSLELFDEFEEFHLKCVHYVVAVAGNGVCSAWIDTFPHMPSRSLVNRRKFFKWTQLNSNIELCRHSSCNIREEIYLFGGCNRERRSKNIYKVSQKTFPNVETDQSDVKLEMVYGSTVCFDLDQLPFVCVYGGRTSPDKMSNNGLLTVFEFIDGRLCPKLSATQGNPTPRYRTAMTSLNPTESEARCWIFGGRTSDLKVSLSDFWELSLRRDSEGNLTYSWKEHERKKDWPCGRMSHSFTSCPEKLELFISSGLNLESSSVLNDIWKWSCESESWQKIELAGGLLPRYGHTSHLKGDVLYLIGGVNTLAGVQPGLAVVNLKNGTVAEYSIPESGVEPVLLFNHTSDVLDDRKDPTIRVWGGGGNCFSFGTYLNQSTYSIHLNSLEEV